MKVVVTGGAGFIGRHTVRSLLGTGCQVLVVDDFSTSNPQALAEFDGHPGFMSLAGDVCDEPLVQETFARYRPDAVVHLAGLVSVARSIEHPGESRIRNVVGTRVVAETAASTGCRRFVFASSAAVYSDSMELPLLEDAVLPPPLSPYGEHKAEGERLLASMGSRTMTPVILRYFNVFGPGQHPDSPYSGVITRFLGSASTGTPLVVFGDGEQTRDFVHVGDVARINVLAASGKMPSSTYNVCSGTGTTVNTLVSELRGLAPHITVEHQAARDGEIRHSVGSVARLVASLPEGWHPVSLSRGLRDLMPLRSRE